MIMINTIPLILNGRDVAAEVQKKIIAEVNTFKLKDKRPPGLAVILVGENPASYTYVKNKEKTCIALSFYSKVHRLPTNISENELIQLINSLNNDTKIDGILVQLPLPIHIKQENIINEINPRKDVDGLHPSNLGKLLSGQKCLKPCTPLAVLQILKYYSINLNGISAVVIGRSTLVGKPLSLLLLRENATVTLVHSKSENIENITKSADILIAAVGKANLVKRNWVKKDAIIIDVGINKVTEGETSKLVGDVDFNDVSPICQAITPVPGGVGPVTIAMLMHNTFEAYKINISHD